MRYITQLLQQIADNTARDDSLCIAVVSAGAAILGAGVTAIFSYFVAKKPLKLGSKSNQKDVCHHSYH